MAYNPWLEEKNVELLKKLYVEGLSCSQIAARIGNCSRNAVIGKINRLGLSGRIAPRRGGRPKSTGLVPRDNRNTFKNRILNARLRAESARSALEAVAAKVPKLPVNLKALLDLTDQDCRYIEGVASGTKPCFCAKPKLIGSSYCIGHHLLTSQPASPRSRPETPAAAPAEKQAEAV